MEEYGKHQGDEVKETISKAVFSSENDVRLNDLNVVSCV